MPEDPETVLDELVEGVMSCSGSTGLVEFSNPDVFRGAMFIMKQI